MSTTTKTKNTTNTITINNIEVTTTIEKKLKELQTVSSKIRYLHSQNFTRSQIATILNKRYQHVRNVLITPITKQK